MDLYEDQAISDLASPPVDGQVTQPANEIVFIDGSVPDALLLAAGVNPGVQAVVLDPSQDGVQQIAAYLAAQGSRKFASIALVSHGASGLLQLGTAMLNATTIGQYTNELAQIGASIDPGGDLLLFGCDVAQDEAGVAFVHQLSDALGGVDIAAASHLVGSADQGGSFTLDVNTGTIEAVTPFTPATQAAFSSLLPTAVNQLYFTTQGAPSPFTANGIRQVGVSGSTSVGTITALRDGSQQTLVSLPSVAVDPATGKYFVVNSNASTANQILQGNVLSPGSLSVVVALPVNSPITHQIAGVAIDQPNGMLYYTVDANAANAGSIGVWKIPEIGGTPTQVVGNIASGGAVFTSSNVPLSLALDLPNNLVFFTEGTTNGTTRLWVGNVQSGTASILATSTSGKPFRGIAVNSGTVYYSTINAGTVANNAIYAAPYTVSGSGASATAALGAVSTLYTGASAGMPFSLAVDPVNGLLYTMGSESLGTYSQAILNVGTVSGGGSVQRVITFDNGTNGVTGTGLFLESTPTVTASGTVGYVQNGSAVTLAPAATVVSPSGFTLAGASVAISGAPVGSGDTLVATTAGTSINALFSGTTLTLSGIDTAAHYQQVLESVQYSTTGSDPTAGGTASTRTLTWTVSDGIISSASPTTSVNIHGLPTITPGGAATFTGGGSAVAMAPTLSIFDPFSPTLSSATVSVGSFISGDVLNFVNQGGISGSYVAGTGTLSLSGTASIATWQSALQSITYSYDPSNGDPTGGGTHTSRSISWTVNDGVTVSNAAFNTLNVIHAAPTITVSGNVLFSGGGVPIVLDPNAGVVAPNSLDLLSSATITIDSGLHPGDGDVLSADTTGTSITALYDSNTERLTLSGSDSVADYQAVLRTVSISNSSGDPTLGGTDFDRTISWIVNDGVANSAAGVTTATALCFLAGTRIRTPRGEQRVQDLRPGDLVTTHAGAERRLTWIGHGKVLATRGRRNAATPVIVKRGALAPNVPYRDLRVTKGHALYLDDVLVPVEFLVNHRSIIWDDHAQEVDLYHLELDSHDVLVADGAPAESYRDDGNRWLFQNANDGWGLPPQEPCAPLLTGGPVVDALWHRLLDRSGPRAPLPLTDDPDLHLLAAGQRIDPLPIGAGRVAFRLPPNPGTVYLMSRDAIPAELGLTRDFRALGVAVRRIDLSAGRDLRLIEAEDPRLTDGFHAFEPEDAIRWTDGSAVLPADLFDGLRGP
ncbi:MAG: DUF4347 domain-containing protein, partial [Acetobacteraceae bacterium]